MAGLDNITEASQSARWPVTTAKILSSRVVRSGSTVRHSNGVSYSPAITYSYSVNGQSFMGGEITPGRIWGSASSDAIVQAFPAGSQPQIAYSPADPRQALLVPGLHPYNFTRFGFGIIILTVAFLIILLGYGLSRDGKNAAQDSVPVVRRNRTPRFLPWLLGLLFLELIVVLSLNGM
jgi:hypothetical protein